MDFPVQFWGILRLSVFSMFCIVYLHNVIPSASACICVCPRRNIPPGRQLKSCQYNRYNDHLCPIFRVGDIVSEANSNSGDHDATYESIAVKVYRPARGRQKSTHYDSVEQGFYLPIP